MPSLSQEQIIRLNGSIKGSVIWNQAWENRAIIQKHSFWEIGNRNKALFWEDDWQQRSKLDQDQYQQIKTNMQNKGRNRVSQYWKPRADEDRWRIWLDQEDWAPHINPQA